MARTKPLPKIRAGSPIVTNAHLNRESALRCFKAGMSARQIAEAWPEVWHLTVEHGREVLRQKYDYEIADGSGRYETNRRITVESVREAIDGHRAAGTLGPKREI